MKESVMKYAVAAAAMLLLSFGVSCNRSKKSAAAEPQSETPQGSFRIEKVEDFKVNSLTSYEITLSVANPLRYEFQLNEGTVELFYAGTKLGTIISDGEVTIPKRATTSVTLPLSLEIENPIAIYGALGKLQRGETDRMTLTVRAVLKVAGSKRTFVQENIPLDTVLRLLGADGSGLKNLINF